MVTKTTSTRSKARKRALDILFEAELRDADPLATLGVRAEDATPPVRDFTRELVEGVTAHASEIDRRIIAALTQRIPEIEAPSDVPQSPTAATEQPGRVEPQPQVEGAQEGAERRSWWQRWFGG